MQRRRHSRVVVVLAAVLLLGGLPPGGVAQDGGGSPGVEGDRYLSPTYGFGLSWDTDWRVEGATSTAGVDTLRLTNGTGVVTFMARPFAGDPTACVQTHVARLQTDPAVVGLAPAVDGEGNPLAGSDELGAYAILNYRGAGADGAETELSAYLDCRPLPAGGAVLLIEQVVPVAAYNDEIGPRGELLDSLVLDASLASAQPDDSTAPVQPSLLRWRQVTDVTARQLMATDGLLCVVSWELIMLDPATGQELWRRGRDLSPPVFADGMVYVNALTKQGGAVYALDPATGQEQWKVDTAALEGYPLPVVAGSVYVADAQGDLLALDAATGQERWRQRLDWGTGTAPVVADGIVYASDAGGVFYAFDTETGAELWRAADVWAPSIASGSVYMNKEGIVYAFDAATGQEQWRAENADGLSDDASLAIKQFGLQTADTIYADASDRTADGTPVSSLVALDPTTGQERWRTSPAESISIGDVVGATVYAIVGEAAAEATPSTKLVALDVATGQERWRSSDVRSLGVSEVTEDTVYAVGTEQSADGTVSSNLLSLDIETGQERWRFREGGDPLVVDGGLYLTSGDSLILLDAATGSERWRMRTGDALSAKPLLMDDTVIVGGAEGGIFAVERQSVEAFPPDSISRGQSQAATSESLLSSRRLEPMAAGEGFLGLWRLTVAQGAEVQLPAFAGTVFAFVQSGTLAIAPGVDVSVDLGRLGWVRKDIVVDGDSFAILPDTAHVARNDSSSPAEVLITSVLATGPPDITDQADSSLELLGGGPVDSLPDKGAVLNLHRVGFGPDAVLPPQLSARARLIVVESGAIDLQVLSGQAASSDPTHGTMGDGDAVTLGVGATALLQAETLFTIENANEGPLTMLTVEVWAWEVLPPMAGGCGGRCISVRRPM